MPTFFPVQVHSTSTTATDCSPVYRSVPITCERPFPAAKPNTINSSPGFLVKNALWKFVSMEKQPVWTYPTRLQHAVQWKPIRKDSGRRCSVVLQLSQGRCMQCLLHSCAQALLCSTILQPGHTTCNIKLTDRKLNKCFLHNYP